MKKKMLDFSPEHEAEIFGRYLIHVSPTNSVKELYAGAMLSTINIVTAQDQKLLKFVRKNYWSIGFIDSGLAILNANSEVRRRLYILFSILESSPEYHHLFLTKKRNKLYLIMVIFSYARAILKALTGSLLIRIIG